MSDHPNTAVGDAAYWGLTPSQATHYYVRVVSMRTQAARDRRRTWIVSRISIALGVVVVALVIVSAVKS